MGSKYPVLPPEKVIKVLTKNGFVKVSQRGSHVKARGTLRGILEQAGITLDEFMGDLNKI